MILKRQEKDNVIKAIYKSSNILASTYNKETNELVLIFNKGSQYKYTGVKLSDYTRLELAESQGIVFNTHIKPYPFEKMDNIDVVILPQIINEIENLYAEEKKAMILAKSNNLRSYILSICGDEDSVLSVSKLEELQIKISNYLNETSK